MSTKLTIKEAVEVIPVSESTLRRDMKSGKVSSEKDPQGRRRIDVSELQRAYGQLKHQNGKPEQSDEYANNGHLTNDDTPKIITVLEGQVQDLKEQLEKAENRESALIEEKKELRDMLKAEQARTLALTPAAQEERTDWWSKLTGRT